jgi:hypothetical protein
MANDTEAINGEKHQVEPRALGLVVQPDTVPLADAKRQGQVISCPFALFPLNSNVGKKPSI